MEQFTLFYGGPFGQWYMCNFVVDGITYNCAEQYMMAQKAIYFHDMLTYRNIMSSHNPKSQKALGRRVKGFNSTQWNEVARDIVYKGNYEKFTQNIDKSGDDIFDKLMKTCGTTLVEASPYDIIWGIGLGEDNPDALDKTKWKGLNWLGETLTKLKENLLIEMNDF